MAVVVGMVGFVCAVVCVCLVLFGLRRGVNTVTDPGYLIQIRR